MAFALRRLTGGPVTRRVRRDHVVVHWPIVPRAKAERRSEAGRKVVWHTWCHGWGCPAVGPRIRPPTESGRGAHREDPCERTYSDPAVAAMAKTDQRPCVQAPDARASSRGVPVLRPNRRKRPFRGVILGTQRPRHGSGVRGEVAAREYAVSPRLCTENRRLRSECLLRWLVGGMHVPHESSDPTTVSGPSWGRWVNGRCWSRVGASSVLVRIAAQRPWRERSVVHRASALTVRVVLSLKRVPARYRSPM